jgi:Tfp pilus assembly protein PilN
VRAVNLLPKGAERARRTTPDPAILVGVVGFGAVVVSLFLMFSSASSKLIDLRSQRDLLKAELAQQSRVKPYLPVQESISGPEAERIGAVASALSYRIPWDYVLGQISLALPKGVKLTSLAATTPVSANPQYALAASEAATNLKLDGWTYSQESVAQLLTRLQLLPSIVRTSVNLNQSTITTGAQPYYAFTVSAKIRAPGVVT